MLLNVLLSALVNLILRLMLSRNLIAHVCAYVFLMRHHTVSFPVGRSLQCHNLHVDDVDSKPGLMLLLVGLLLPQLVLHAVYHINNLSTVCCSML